MMRRIDPLQNSVCHVADNYLFSSAALSMFRFDITHDSRLDMFLKLGAYLKFQQKRAFCHQTLTSPPHVIMSSHVIFWPTPSLPLKWWRHLWTAPYILMSFKVNTKSHIRLQILSVVFWGKTKMQIDYRNWNIQKQITILQLQALPWHIIEPSRKHSPHLQSSLQLDIAWLCFLHPNR